MSKSSLLDKIPPTAMVVIAVLLWSTAGLLFKMTSVTAYEANLGRCLLAAVTIAILTRFKAFKADRFTFIAAFFYVGALSFFAIANKMTTAANAIFLQYTAPIYILVLGPFLLREKFKFTDLFVVVACLAGMSLFFLDEADVSTFSHETQQIGNLMALLSGVSLGVYILLLRHPRSFEQNPSASVLYGNLIAIVVMLPFVIDNPTKIWTSNDFIAIGALGVVQIGLAYFLFTQGVARGVRSLNASIIGFLEPLLNPVWVFLFIGEIPTKWALTGGAVIIAAVAGHTWISSLTKEKQSHPASALPD
jgi:drug/metabolite transporter (DMT)-like permease